MLNIIAATMVFPIYLNHYELKSFNEPGEITSSKELYSVRFALTSKRRIPVLRN